MPRTVNEAEFRIKFIADIDAAKKELKRLEDETAKAFRRMSKNNSVDEKMSFRPVILRVSLAYSHQITMCG